MMQTKKQSMTTITLIISALATALISIIDANGGDLSNNTTKVIIALVCGAAFVVGCYLIAQGIADASQHYRLNKKPIKVTTTDAHPPPPKPAQASPSIEDILQALQQVNANK